jgi:hypothetical protein
MKYHAQQIRKVQRALNCDYGTAVQLLRETNSTEEAIELGRRMLGR